MRTFAIDIDDTLNDFTDTLRSAEFARDESHALSEDVFREYLAKVRSGAADGGELLSTEFSFFRHKIHHQCYEKSRVRPDGAAFVRELKRRGWRIVICTYRDLRRTQESTRRWLSENGVPFDHLFMAGNKIVFCKAWGIEYLIDDDPFNIEHGERHGVSVFYPEMGRIPAPAAGAVRSAAAPRAFNAFDEILPWIPS